jgi:hypothetical protein
VVETLDIPMARKGSGEVQAADELDIAASLRAPPQLAEKTNGKGLWPRNYECASVRLQAKDPG